MATYTTTLANLDTLLKSLSKNTFYTPYDIEITDLTTADFGSALRAGSLGYILRNNGLKYVDLRPTTLPNGITSLRESFYSCGSIVYFTTIPSSVTDMYSTFTFCHYLKEAPNIPNGVTNIYQAFMGCEWIKKTPLLPDTITDMAWAFAQCNRLETITNIPSSVTALSCAFQKCTSLERLPVIPSSVTGLDRTFEGCTKLKYVAFNIADFTNVSVTDIFKDASLDYMYVPSASAQTSFINVTTTSDLPDGFDTSTQIHISYTVSSVADLNMLLQSLPTNTAALPYYITVTGLTTSDIGQSTSSGRLGYVLRNNITKYVDISSTILPSDLTSLYYSFYGCSNIVYFTTIPSNVNEMTMSFYDCTALAEMPELPEGLISLTSTFYNCSSIKKIKNIPNSITNMYSTFQNCTSLEEIPEIPSNITNLTSTFCNCSSLKSIIFHENITNLSTTCSGCTSLETIIFKMPYIGDRSTWTWTSVFKNCTNVKSIIIIGNNNNIQNLRSQLSRSDNIPSNFNYSNILVTDYICKRESFDSVLKSMSVNTIDTPYDICITDISAEPFVVGSPNSDLGTPEWSGTIGYDIKNNNKYISLYTTPLPNNAVLYRTLISILQHKSEEPYWTQADNKQLLYVNTYDIGNIIFENLKMCSLSSYIENKYAYEVANGLAIGIITTNIDNIPRMLSLQPAFDRNNIAFSTKNNYITNVTKKYAFVKDNTLPGYTMSYNEQSGYGLYDAICTADPTHTATDEDLAENYPLIHAARTFRSNKQYYNNDWYIPTTNEIDYSISCIVLPMIVPYLYPVKYDQYSVSYNVASGSMYQNEYLYYSDMYLFSTNNPQQWRNNNVNYRTSIYLPALLMHKVGPQYDGSQQIGSLI